MCEKLFTKDEEEKIIAYSDGNVKPLDECENTKEAYFKKEEANGNLYRLLAERFQLYNCVYPKDKTLSCAPNCDDKFFYLYLKNIGKTHEYDFPLENGGTVTAKVDIFNPFVSVTFENETREMVNPQWHLLISLYAYHDAVHNHENEKLKKAEINKTRKIVNRVLKTWISEAKS